jgi:hypothetical protein
MADSGNLYRLIVATTSANLSNINCQVTDGVSIITLRVTNCLIPLKADLLSFNGKLLNNHARLSWTTSREEEPIEFDIEKSTDGISYVFIGRIDSYNDYSSDLNRYSYIDPAVFSEKAWYRIVMTNHAGQKKYSNIVALTNNIAEFALDNVVNPFSTELVFQISMNINSTIDVALMDLSGKVVKTDSFKVKPGVNSVTLENTASLPPAIYILRVNNSGMIIRNKVLKK